MMWLWVGIASAYTLSGNSWTYHDQPVEEPFHIATNSFPSDFSSADLIAAHAEAVRVWNVQGGADLRLTSGGHSDNSQYGNGNNDWNVVSWDDWRWGSTLGIAARTVVGSEIRDCDINIVGANNNGTTTWSLDPAGAPDGANDMRHTLIHELGHCIGVDHSNVDSALMGPYAPSDQGLDSRVLKADDIAAVQAVYGTAAPSIVIADVLQTATDTGVELQILLENVGDGTAYGILGDLELGDSHELVVLEAWSGELGDLPAGGTVGSASDALLATLLFSESCVDTQEATVDLLLSDEAGNLWRDALDLTLPCPEALRGSGGGVDGAACGCSQNGGSSPGTLLWAGVVTLLARRRRRLSSPSLLTPR